MPWWSSKSTQPKLKNRFLVEIGNGGKLLSVATVTKPTVLIEPKEYKMINHFYSYPGIPKWDPITITFVDAKIWGTGNIKPGEETEKLLERSTSKQLWEMLLSSGYVTPNGTKTKGVVPVVSPEKAAMIDLSFGNSKKKTDGSLFKIHQLDPTGKRSTETWTIYNPIITKISWGDLDYGSDELVEYSLDVTYDWAELTEGHSV